MVYDDVRIADFGKGVNAPAELDTHGHLGLVDRFGADRILGRHGEGTAQRVGILSGRGIEPGQPYFGKAIDRARLGVERDQISTAGIGGQAGVTAGSPPIGGAAGTAGLGGASGASAGSAPPLAGSFSSPEPSSCAARNARSSDRAAWLVLLSLLALAIRRRA